MTQESVPIAATDRRVEKSLSVYKTITVEGLWRNNPALVQLLGLCPLLAVSNSAMNGLGLGLATLFVLMLSNTTVSFVRNWVPNEIRVPVFVMLIATFVTTTELIIQAFKYQLYTTLGIFIPLIVTNCAILGRAEAFASKNKLLPAVVDGLMQGLGFALVLMMLGCLRELFGQGTLFSQTELLFNFDLTFQVFSIENGALLALLPPGAFIMMGFILAIKNLVDS